jgi:alkylhydroperoxidase/carboxymuconolactone decarboxylase family protein YurZ
MSETKVIDMQILTTKQHELYDSFCESIHHNDHLDSETELLVGLSAELAMKCEPCIHYYSGKANASNITRGEISEVITKVMAVSAGQKRLQAEGIINTSGITFE